MRKKLKKEADCAAEDKIFPLPVYKAEDDIYIHDQKVSFEEDDNSLEKDSGYKELNPGEDLDIPGAELDDANEAIGEEDEENNYYSLGGDNKNSLEEDNQQ